MQRKNDKEILEKAIQKAVRNGWEPLTNGVPVEVLKWDGKGSIEIALLYDDPKKPAHWIRELEGIIFNHDFAKALWGNGINEPKDNGYRLQNKSYSPLRIWQWHLTQLSIADDPIQYLGENI